MLKIFIMVLLFILAKSFVLPSQQRLSSVVVMYPELTGRSSQPTELLQSAQSAQYGTYHSGTYMYGNQGLGWKATATGNRGGLGWRAGNTNRYGNNFNGNTASYGWKHG